MSLSRTAALGAAISLAGCHKAEIMPDPYAKEAVAGEATCPIIPDVTGPEELFDYMQKNYHRMLSETARAMTISMLPRLEGEVSSQTESRICWYTFFDCVGTGHITSCQSKRPNGDVLIQTAVYLTYPEKGVAHISDVEITIDPENPKNNQVISFTKAPAEHPSIMQTTNFNGPLGIAIEAEFQEEKSLAGGCFVPQHAQTVENMMATINQFAQLD